MKYEGKTLQNPLTCLRYSDLEKKECFQLPSQWDDGMETCFRGICGEVYTVFDKEGKL